jgi:hypothetical protein
MNVYDHLDQFLSGAPDRMITFALIAIAIAGIAIAIWAPRPIKFGLLLYWLVP